MSFYVIFYILYEFELNLNICSLNVYMYELCVNVLQNEFLNFKICQ